MSLQDLILFRTTSEVVRSTKFLIRRVHDRSLWLDMRYPIHAKDIHQLTGLSLEGEDVSKGFQGMSKNDKNKGEIILYERFHTQHGNRTTKIEPIFLEMVRTTCYVIYGRSCTHITRENAHWMPCQWKISTKWCCL
jgi:hypothetical protein